MPHEQDAPAWKTDNLFTGTAWYYARYRPPYPDDVTMLLINKFKLTPDSCVLDLGCGTGQAALKLAPHVSQVYAVDPQEDMLYEGKQAASALSISNITWLKGESGNLPELAAKIGKVKLTVIARAFHWMDRAQTLADLYEMTLPGGGVAVIADNGPADSQVLPWKQAIIQTVKKWLGEERKAGTEGIFKHPEKPFEEYLTGSPFRGFELFSLEISRNWTVDDITGYMYSTSMASPPVLGDNKKPFEADLRRKLLEIEPSGKFVEPVTVKVMMVWNNRR